MCEESKTGTDAQVVNLNTTSVDCIVQGALRNTYNDIPSTYNPFTDGSNWTSITWPTELNNFFENKIHKHCVCSTYLYYKSCYEKLSKIDYNDKFVIALIHQQDHQNNFGSGLAVPNHFVQILGVNEDGGIRYWQYGEKENKYISNTDKCYGLYIIDK